MKVFVYGKNTDDKGTQLEALTSAILKGMGYKVIRNEVKAGGNELDVVATKEEPFGGEISLVCECKAHNNLITMNDWLKFIGKLHLEQRKNQMTHGLMIALSGANGNVLGSYKEIKTDNYITLITNEDIFEHIQNIHAIASEAQASDIISLYTRKDVVECNIIYYNNVYYWYICFPNGEYTILNDDFSNVDSAELKEGFSSMVESQTNSVHFVDIKEEHEAVQRRSLIRSLILAYTLDESHTIQEITDWINALKPDLHVQCSEVEGGVSYIPYMQISNDEHISIMNESEIDFIQFYRFIFADMVATRVLATTFYKNHINKDLLNRIRQLQGDIQLSDENVEECLFLLKHSPSAMAYAINEDQAITRYRSKGKAFFQTVEKGHTEWFLNNVLNGFIKDYENQELSEYFLDAEKIASIEIHTNLKIFKDGYEPFEMHHFKSECIGRLGKEYNNKAILMVKLPDVEN